jgi:hypothetical protein
MREWQWKTTGQSTSLRVYFKEILKYKYNSVLHTMCQELASYTQKRMMK